MAYNFASLFSAVIVGESFNMAIERDAENGGVATIFLNAISAQYGFELPAKPKDFVVCINRNYLSADKGKVSVIGLVQALHNVAGIVIAAGKVKGLPELLALPAWADPIAIEAAKVAKVEAAKVAKVAKVEAAKVEAAKVAKVAKVEAAKVAKVEAAKIDPATVANLDDSIIPNTIEDIDFEAIVSPETLIGHIRKGLYDNAELKRIMGAITTQLQVALM